MVIDDDVGGDGVGVHGHGHGHGGGGGDGDGDDDDGDVFGGDDVYPQLPLTPFHSLGWFF